MRERRTRLNKATDAVNAGDFDEAKRLVSEVVYGVSAGKYTDPGMAGSLLYHMAMVTKMGAETRFLLQEFQADDLHNEGQTLRFYSDFTSDVTELLKAVLEVNVKPNVIDTTALGTDRKIALFLDLAEKTRKTLQNLENKTPISSDNLETLFREWGTLVVEMRLRQEYETIKGLLISSELVNT